MVETQQSGKLAVILHADVVGSTELVQRDERKAHERVQEVFHRFSDTIKGYHQGPLSGNLKYEPSIQIESNPMFYTAKSDSNL